ncbi:hypothetical protein, partial [Paraburkholderia terrae]|uniref:hypothetical protein n=1 Tax=Paraburkholderia terrae TaxID=311230 RepID=UPI001EE39BF5
VDVYPELTAIRHGSLKAASSKRRLANPGSLALDPGEQRLLQVQVNAECKCNRKTRHAGCCQLRK